VRWRAGSLSVLCITRTILKFRHLTPNNVSPIQYRNPSRFEFGCFPSKKARWSTPSITGPMRYCQNCHSDWKALGYKRVHGWRNIAVYTHSHTVVSHAFRFPTIHSKRCSPDKIFDIGPCLPYAASEDQSLCRLNFFFMSGANSPILFITTPTQACVNTLW